MKDDGLHSTYQLCLWSILLAAANAIEKTGVITGTSEWTIENSALVAGNDVRPSGNYTIQEVISPSTAAAHAPGCHRNPAIYRQRTFALRFGTAKALLSVVTLPNRFIEWCKYFCKILSTCRRTGLSTCVYKPHENCYCSRRQTGIVKVYFKSVAEANSDSSWWTYLKPRPVRPFTFK